ncbi:hypothetical protein EDD16DRAFT_946765 [Pisolithus croceorrhizus]|nr:hypothetical protein EDD16DRAFT_946765 [Pisolithus croceorrhizus]
MSLLQSSPPAGWSREQYHLPPMILGHLVVPMCQPTQEGCAAAAARLGLCTGSSESTGGCFSLLGSFYCVFIAFFHEYIALRVPLTSIRQPCAFVIPPTSPTRYLDDHSSVPLANWDYGCTRRYLSNGILFVAVAPTHAKISQFLGRQAVSHCFANISGLGAPFSLFPRSPNSP